MRQTLLRLCLFIFLLEYPMKAALAFCGAFCCGYILMTGSVGDEMYGFAWATTYVACQDGTQCYTSYWVDCFLGQCSLEVAMSGC